MSSMSSMSQQTIAIKQAPSPSNLVRHLPKIHPESDAMTSAVMESLKRRGPAMTAGVMRICLDANDTLLLSIHEYYREKPVKSS